MTTGLNEYKMGLVFVTRDLIRCLKEKHQIKFSLKKETWSEQREKYASSLPKYGRNNWPGYGTAGEQDIQDKFRESVKTFTRVMEQTTPEHRKEDLNTLYSRLQTLKVYGIKFQLAGLLEPIRKMSGKEYNIYDGKTPFIEERFIGMYKIQDNTILIDTSKYGDPTIIFHELLHMASCHERVGENGKELTKFGLTWMLNGRIVFGRGLNDGMTNYLGYKKFKDYGFKEKREINTLIAELLADVIGEDVAESMFLNGDIVSYVRELAKYFPTDGRGLSAENEVVSFIKRIDDVPKSNLLQEEGVRIINLFYVPLKMFITKQLYEYKRIDAIPYENIIGFLNKIPNEITNPPKKIVIDKDALIRDVFDELNYYYPQIGYQTIYSQDNFHQRAA